MLSFKPAFSFSFTFIKRPFSYSSLSAIRVVSSAYLRLLIFLPAILIPACVWITTNCGKFLKRWNTRPPYLPPENLYAGQEATVRTRHGTMTWFQIGKGVCQGCILSPCLFNLYAKYIMQNAGLDEAQAGISISRRNTKPQICR